jgi:hypothetical protein
MYMAWLQAKSQATQARPGQAKSVGLDVQEAKANGPGHGFEHNFCKQFLPIIISLALTQQALKSKFL